MSDKWNEALVNAVKAVEQIGLFQTLFWDQKKFIDYVNRFNRHLEIWSSIWFMGHFDNAFAEIVEEHLDPARAKIVDVRALSLQFHKDSRGNKNRRALEKLERLGVKVRVNDNLHARMMLLYDERSKAGGNRVVLGSFDFNRDGLSRVKRNVGVWTFHSDVIEAAKEFFEDVWESSDTVTLEEYTKNK